AGQVLVHPFVIGELACGNLAGRREMLRFLGEMPSAPVASHDEALAFLESQALMGKGIGLVDLHLLASTSLADPALLWTRDKSLARVAGKLGLAYEASR
ncbi:MAG: VapC toxin family PIN domain ribonuclease, partial [Thermoanaerobaculia bacterium]